MRKAKLIQTAVPMLVVLTFAGCTQHYNGAFSWKDMEAALAGQTAHRPVASVEDSATSEATAATASPAHHSAAADLPGTSAAAHEPGIEIANAAYAAHSEPTTMRPMALYGQLNDKAVAALGSPLDSPENYRRVSFAGEGADFDPDIDPTGRWLVYASTRHRQTSDVYLSRVGGTAVTQLTDDPGNDVMPAFSPDGSKIAFASDRSGNWDIYVIDMDGGKAIQLTNDPTHDIHPSWSPDGRQLVYCTYGSQSGQWELVLIDAQNPATKRFIGNGLFPNWSPTDNTIVYQRARQRGTRWFSVWTVSIEDGEGIRPTEIAASANAACITPDYSPDGGHVVFCTVVNPDTQEHQAPAQADVWMVAADGSGRINLTASRFTNLQPVWGKDGSIYFVSNRGQGAIENVWSVGAQRAVAMAQAMNGRGEAQTATHAAPQTPPDATAAVPTE